MQVTPAVRHLQCQLDWTVHNTSSTALTGRSTIHRRPPCWPVASAHNLPTCAKPGSLLILESILQYCEDSASMPESLSCHPVLEVRPPVLEIHNLNWLPCGPNPGLPSCAIAEAQNMIPAFCTITCLTWVSQQASIDSGLCHMACGPSQSVVSQGCVLHMLPLRKAQVIFKELWDVVLEPSSCTRLRRQGVVPTARTRRLHRSRPSVERRSITLTRLPSTQKSNPMLSVELNFRPSERGSREAHPSES